jgi:hypothetical protein
VLGVGGRLLCSPNGQESRDCLGDLLPNWLSYAPAARFWGPAIEEAEWPRWKRGHVCAAPPGPRGGSAATRLAWVSWDHRSGSLMDRGDDLGVVDPAQVPRRDGEVGVPEL